MGDALIFPSAKRTTPLSDMALSAVIRRMNEDRPEGAPPPWRDADGREAVPHGFRATFRTWVDDTRPEDAEAAEKALAHEDANKVRGRLPPVRPVRPARPADGRVGRLVRCGRCGAWRWRLEGQRATLAEEAQDPGPECKPACSEPASAAQMAEGGQAPSPSPSQGARRRKDALRALNAREPSREQLHLLLDLALDFAGVVAQDLDIERARLLATVVQKILKAGFSLLTGRLIQTQEHADAHGGDPTEVRRRLVMGLIRLPSLMPPADRKLLAAALLSLDRPAEDVPPLFRRPPKKGRGADPARARAAEERAWEWIWQEHARTGQPIGRLKAKVADSTGLTPEAVEKWREAWLSREGRNTVRVARMLADAMGRFLLETWSEEGSASAAPDAEAHLAMIVADWQGGRLPTKARTRASRPK